MPDVSAKVEWLIGSDKALAEVGTKATQRNVLRRALTTAAKPIEDAVEGGAPVETGFTSRSFATSPTQNPAQKRASRGEQKGFAEVYVGTRRGSAAHLKEYGTFKMPAAPFFRPAWDANKDKAEQILGKELWVEIEKAAQRAAKKRAKAGL